MKDVPQIPRDLGGLVLIGHVGLGQGVEVVRGQVLGEPNKKSVPRRLEGLEDRWQIDVHGARLPG